MRMLAELPSIFAANPFRPIPGKTSPLRLYWKTALIASWKIGSADATW
jgi:hypothetical protein